MPLNTAWLRCLRNVFVVTHLECCFALEVELHWMSCCTECWIAQIVLLHWMLNWAECPLALNVELHRMSSCAECWIAQNVLLHWMLNCTECPLVLNVEFHWMSFCSECWIAPMSCCSECPIAQCVLLHRPSQCYPACFLWRMLHCTGCGCCTRCCWLLALGRGLCITVVWFRLHIPRLLVGMA